MKTTVKRRTSIPGTTPLTISSQRLGSKKARVGEDIQATIRKFKDLHEAEIRFNKTIKAEKKRLAETLVTYMGQHNFEELHDIRSNFYIVKKKRNNYTFTIDTQRLKSELKFQEQLEIDTDQAQNDPTIYVSPLYSKQ